MFGGANGGGLARASARRRRDVGRRPGGRLRRRALRLARTAAGRRRPALHRRHTGRRRPGRHRRFADRLPRDGAQRDVATTGVLGGPRFAVSASGALVYVPGAASGPQGLRWLRNPVAATPDALAEALVLDCDFGADARLTSMTAGGHGHGIAVHPAWRPDGLEVAFALNKSGPFNLFVQPGLGGVATPLGESP